MAAGNVASPKRVTPKRVEMATRYERLYEITELHQPASVRHVYYQAVVAGVVEKTESGYVKVQRALADMRIKGVMPFEWIVDNTRWMRKPRSYDDVESCLAETAALYRKNLWAASDQAVEVWAESDSIAGVIQAITSRWNVPLMVTRGYTSLSFARSAVEEWNRAGKDVTVYYVGDHDPAGLAIEAKLVEYIDEWRDVYARVERVGVTWEQVERFNLPGGPPKKPYGFPIAVEAEALPPGVLRDLLDESIAEHVDQHQLEAHRVAEREERVLLRALADWKVA